MKTLKILYVLLLIFSIQPSFAQVKWEGKDQNPDDLVKTGLKYVEQNQLNEAIQLAKTVLNKYPSYLDFTYIMGISYLKMGNYDWSAQYFRQIIASNPNYLDAYSGLARSLWKLGNYQEADAIWTTSNFLEKDQNYVHQLKKEYDEETLAQRNTLKLEQTLKGIAQKNSLADMQLLDSILLAHPDRLDVLQLKANITHFNNPDLSIGLYRQLILEKYEAESNLNKIAAWYASKKEYHQAAEIMDSLIILNPKETAYTELKSVYEDNKTYTYYLILDQSFVSYDRPVGTYFMSGLGLGAKLNPKISLSGQVNWANLRNGEGFQYLLESWMNYSKTVYSYNSVAYSTSLAFPTWRAAYTIYKEFPTWQVDLGLRYMKPQIGEGNYSGVASIGKYIGANFFYLRSFLTFDQDRIETSFAGSWRYYYNENKPETFFTILGNLGTSPDDRERYLFYNNPSVFKSYAIGMGIQHKFGKYIVGSNGNWSIYKITDINYLNQFNLNLSLKRYF
ncbi:YaiO family outer membrane beta-barrel protein [Sphingobacterium sp. HJSM2_6]|uniref:YaiO family outer membrane beta-barrel protein n=1 Tax=Sphingobacterium sp. HJSM2_6 TaxID=3366264 RepID=UPI003BECD499